MIHFIVSTRKQSDTLTVILILLIPIVLLKAVPFSDTFAQVDLVNQPETNGLIVQGVNATSPSGRERDIYTITGGGDTYRITGEVLNNDTVRFGGVRVSAILFDNNSQFIGQGSAHTTPSGIQPGSTATFEINFFETSVMGGISAIGNFTLQVSGNRQALSFQ